MITKTEPKKFEINAQTNQYLTILPAKTIKSCVLTQDGYFPQVSKCLGSYASTFYPMYVMKVSFIKIDM